MSEPETLETLFLNENRMCQRGVRVRELPVDVVQAIEEEAFANVRARGDGSEQNPIARMNEKWRIGSMRMIAEITDPVTSLDGATWHPVTLKDLMMEGPLKFERLFPRMHDRTTIGQKYAEIHEPTQAAVEAVLGKAFPVMKE